MSGIIVSGDTSGSVTLSAPAVAGTVTVTLPAASGTMLTTASTGVVTQAMLSTNVAGNGPAFSAYPSGAVSCSNYTQTLMTHDTVIYNLGGCYNNTGSTATLNGLSVLSYAFCPNVAGYYLVTSTTFLVASTGSIQTQSWKNGTSTVSPSASCPNNSSGVGPSVTGLVYLNGTGDYVRSYTYQTSAGTVSTLANRADLFGFSAALVRAA